MVRSALVSGALLICAVGSGAFAETVLVAEQRVEHVDVAAREPMIAEHPSGTLFVAGYGAPQPTLWTSADRGASWRRVDVGPESAGAVGNSDVDLAVAPDGTLYYVVMSFDRKTFEGVGVAIGVSHDIGATWRWSSLSRNRFDDRPWVEVAPDGTAHVIWNDGVFAGKVGTGFDGKLLRALRARLDALEVPARPFTRGMGFPRLGAHWVRPEVVVQVAFIEWTVHDKLRHARLLGLREDKTAREVTRET